MDKLPISANSWIISLTRAGIILFLVLNISKYVEAIPLAGKYRRSERGVGETAPFARAVELDHRHPCHSDSDILCLILQEAYVRVSESAGHIKHDTSRNLETLQQIRTTVLSSSSVDIKKRRHCDGDIFCLFSILRREAKNIDIMNNR